MRAVSRLLRCTQRLEGQACAGPSRPSRVLATFTSPDCGRRAARSYASAPVSSVARPVQRCRSTLSGHLCRPSAHRTHATATQPQVQPQASPWMTEIEAEHAEILRCCKDKVDELRRIQSAPVESMSVEEQKQRMSTLRNLSPLGDAWDRYIQTRKAIIDLSPHLSEKDESLREMFAMEMDSEKERLDDIVAGQLTHLLLPPVSSASLPTIISLNVGIGGGEAARFLEELAKMYKAYADAQGWQVETLSETDGPMAKGIGGNGLRETTIKFVPRTYGGDDNEPVSCYGDLMWESGIHRVQRVPPGSTVDKMHSSTVNVTVSPIYADTPEEPLIDPKDVKQENMRARGAGGQHVNKTESAVRLTHVPTGIVVSMQDSRSQHQNREWAWDVLRARISDKKRQEEQEAKRASRADKIKGVFRGDKVRTYNYPQDRVTDHRIGFTTSGLASILDGPGYVKIVDAMKEDFRQRRLEALLEGEEDLDE